MKSYYRHNIFKVFILIFIVAFGCSFLSACSNNVNKDNLKTVFKDSSRVNELLDLKHELRVDENGEFTILVLSDVQFDTPNIASKTLDGIKTIVSRETPDLVIFNGDNSSGIKDSESMKAYITNMTKYVENNKIPWAHVYGNHDAEGDNLPKDIQQEIYESFEYCISKSGDEDLFGIGNYVIPILDYDCDKIVFNVWCFDSGTARSPYSAYQAEHVKVDDNSFYAHYEPMQQNQADWFFEASALLEKYNGESIPGMMAFHIPLQETYYAWANRENLGLEWNGERRENISAHAQDVPLFDAAKENNILAIVNSHDHINDFMVKYNGIRLCYTASIGVREYYAEDMLGGRVIKFSTENPNDVQTYMSYINERS